MNTKQSFKIGRNSVGDKAKCLIIAEISANHNNNFTTIKKLIKSAKKVVLILLKYKLILQIQ